MQPMEGRGLSGGGITGRSIPSAYTSCSIQWWQQWKDSSTQSKIGLAHEG